ncbi:MAG: DUF5597 domain-containing protein [Acidobacteriaceae bacterium]
MIPSCKPQLTSFRTLCTGHALLMCCLTAAFTPTLPAQTTQPHLAKRGDAVQLIVDGKPLLLLAGELHNSSSSSLDYMKPEWPLLAHMGLNTVLVPISWQLVEPVEGQFNFTLVDGLLAQARAQHMHVVFLWLAAWKNGLSGYPPVWVKQDLQRFPRMEQPEGPNNTLAPTNTLSTLSPALLNADSHAFHALMEHIAHVDAREHTVVMMQVENEVGVLGSTRDHSAAANQLFAGPVPSELTQYLQAHRESLNPDLLALWESNGAKTQGTWTEVFGTGPRADEIFMAWQYGHYVQAVAAAGKTAYNIPMYANAWLASLSSSPGSYPTGGPLPWVMDVWKAAGTALDMVSPDLYASDVVGWCSKYDRPGNPLFIPETNSGSAGAANVFYAVGEHNALGFSPFGIDAGMHGESAYKIATAQAAGNADLTQSYAAIAEIMPQLLQAQTHAAVHAFLLTEAHPSADFVLGGVTVHVSLDQIFGNHTSSGYGLILAESPGHFLGAGKGFRVSFGPINGKTNRVGLASIVEGNFRNGTWIPGRHLNGDESDQGNYWRFDGSSVHIERATTYAYP